ncbi:MAG: LrgB family protein, partial [Devosia sp.]|uniref:LrgB family protein n=1 Tax=Devosia sp. TaxID=1871048 RepID=UPI0033981ACA
MSGISEIWVYLSASPLLWLTATILAYLLALAISARLGGTPLANSVLIAGILIIALLQVTGTSYAQYFEGAQFV